MQSAEAVTPGADVRDAGELEQALHRPVLAERAVQHREDDVDVRRARSATDAAGQPRERSPLVAGVELAGGAAPSPSAQRAVAVDLDRDAPRSRAACERARRRCAPTRPRPRARSSGRPRAPRSGGSRRRRRRRGRPRSSSSRSSWSSVVGRRRWRSCRWPVVSVGERLDAACVTSLPTESVTVEPFSSGPLAGILREHEAVLARVGDVLRHDRRLEAARSSSCSRVGCVSPVTSGRRPSAGPSRR